MKFQFKEYVIDYNKSFLSYSFYNFPVDNSSLKYIKIFKKHLF